MTTSPRGPRVRRVSRVIREIDPWSAFRVGIVFHGVLYLMALIALVLLWSVASATGTIDNIERFLESFGWESFQFNGVQLFFNTMFLGLFVVVLLTAIWVLCATVFNLITDLVGGIRVSVLEEEVVVSTVEGEGKRQ
ncbi:MAG: DUF3566 domain-containing protein [Ilumatobacteraceae bacterium]|nr:DUF3566 domain-containing protein [Ilumatobacteraceae bacterium]